MPRFYFNVYDGKSSLDVQGFELPNWEAARIEAIRLAGEILRDEADYIARHEDWRIEVTDSTGLILFWMAFAMLTPAAMRDGTFDQEGDIA